MQHVSRLLELMRCWKDKFRVESAVGASSPTASADEKDSLRRIRTSLEPWSVLEVHYSTWIDNVPRIWVSRAAWPSARTPLDQSLTPAARLPALPPLFAQHLQYLLTHHCDRAADIRDLIGLYFGLRNRPLVAASGDRAEQLHLANLYEAVETLHTDVRILYKRCDAPNVSQWLRDADLKVKAPVGLTLNHMPWGDLCDELLGWSERIVFAYDALSDVEARSREAAKATMQADLEQRALLQSNRGTARDGRDGGRAGGRATEADHDLLCLVHDARYRRCRRPRVQAATLGGRKRRS